VYPAIRNAAVSALNSPKLGWVGMDPDNATKTKAIPSTAIRVPLASIKDGFSLRNTRLRIATKTGEVLTRKLAEATVVI
jgi:hypothetical protein